MFVGIIIGQFREDVCKVDTSWRPGGVEGDQPTNLKFHTISFSENMST